MGEDYGETSPFQFFSDHIDPEIAQATREGRRAEFAAFASFSEEEVPDPQDVATFEHSKLSRRGDETLAELYRDLIAVRRELPPGDAEQITWDEEARWLRVRRGTFELVCNFSTEPLQLRCDAVTLRIATATDVRLGPEAGRKTHPSVTFRDQPSEDANTSASTELHLPPLSGALIERPSE